MNYDLFKQLESYKDIEQFRIIREEDPGTDLTESSTLKYAEKISVNYFALS